MNAEKGEQLVIISIVSFAKSIHWFMVKGKVSPLQAYVASRGPDFMTLGTRRLPLSPGISWYSFLEAESNLGTWTCWMLRKKFRDTTRDRSQDLPTSSAAP
jgi:hypothetical protein